MDKSKKTKSKRPNQKNIKIKSIKDAIHGYIKIEEPYWRIIDTVEFQRLKWIEQTSYRVLYPSARHDRFIHSIGVYHLGQKAFEGFLSNASEKNSDILIMKNKESFLLACLLHDVGHSPFSHTGEKFYNYKNKMEEKDSHLNKIFLSILQEKLDEPVYNNFLKDYGNIKKSPSEHEVMSSIIVAINFSAYLAFFKNNNYDNNPDLDLVIRAIIGCTYAVKSKDSSEYKKEVGVKNCFIRMLNSTMVDVDKLDYIARDTAMSGYENISVDNDRLLASLTYIKDSKSMYYPAFKKSALSVIENVVLAKNSQSKWIVSHPVVVYDSFLLECAIGISLRSLYDANVLDKESLLFDDFVLKIFNYKSLGKEPHTFSDVSINLLSDIDLLSWMKANINNHLALEYFSREERKKPIWKSQAEFEYILGKSDAKKVAEFLQPMLNLGKIRDISKPFSITSSSIADFENSKEAIESKGGIIEIMDFLKEYSISKDKEDFEFNILPAKSNFSTKIKANDVYIVFDPADEVGYTTYDKIISETTNNESEYAFFYIYSNYLIDKKDFLNCIKQFVEEREVSYT